MVKKVKYEHGYRGVEWTNEETWPLLDVRAKERFISKRKRDIVFASPKNQIIMSLPSKTDLYCICHHGHGLK